MRSTLSSSILLLFLFNLPTSSGLAPLLLVAAATPPSASSASSSPKSIPTSNPPSTTTPVPAPELTPPPSIDEWVLQEKWHLTTFWECVTIATDVNCGWHEPVVPGGDEIAAAPGLPNQNLAGLAAAALVVAGLLL